MNNIQARVITMAAVAMVLVSFSSLIVDANECAEENPCDTNTSECFDVRGGFKCLCKHGYKAVPNTHLCERKSLASFLTVHLYLFSPIE